MIKYIKTFIIAINIIYPSYGAACLISLGEPEAIIDEDYYSNSILFIGKVIGAVDNGSQVGVIVKPTEIINIPEKIHQELFEIYSDGLDGLCHSIPIDLLIPIGTEVKVSYPTRFLPNYQDSVNYIIKSAINIIYINERENYSSFTGIYDYSTKRFIDEKRGIDHIVKNPGIFFIEFEILKDLKRLSSSKSKYQKIKIINRILGYPPYQEKCVEFVNKYIPDKIELCGIYKN